MIAVIQRVNHASVVVESQQIASIQRGLVCLLGVHRGDDKKMVEKLLSKIVDFRIFADVEGKMNLSLKDVKGDLLLVSQFTLSADSSRGRRPSFESAEKPEVAELIYEHAIAFAKTLGVKVGTGKFRADMKLQLENDGPVTFVLEP